MMHTEKQKPHHHQNWKWCVLEVVFGLCVCVFLCRELVKKKRGGRALGWTLEPPRGSDVCLFKCVFFGVTLNLGG